jgi:hypothetical protein
MRPTASRGENGGARGRGGDARHREEEGRAPASAVREVCYNIKGKEGSRYRNAA